jgi:hypothetical protein
MKAFCDIPRRVASVLFIIGILWAVLLVPPMLVGLLAIFDFGFDVRSGSLTLHFLCGYGVWLGWLWRSRGLRPLTASSLLWSISFLVNAGFVILWFPGVFGAIIYAWWIAVCVVSIVGLAFEFRIYRDQSHAV